MAATIGPVRIVVRRSTHRQYVVAPHAIVSKRGDSGERREVNSGSSSGSSSSRVEYVGLQYVDGRAKRQYAAVYMRSE